MEKNGPKKSIDGLYGYSILTAAIIELGSLPFIGWNPLFAYGLALGTCVAIVNYNLLVLSSKTALDMGRGISLAVVGYIVRLTIYGGVFLLSYKTGTVSGIATLLGYMTIKLSMFYVYGFKPGFASRRYEKAKIKDLDQDRWAAEEAEKAARPRRFKRIWSIFQSGDDWPDQESKKDIDGRVINQSDGDNTLDRSRRDKED